MAFGEALSVLRRVGGPEEVPVEFHKHAFSSWNICRCLGELLKSGDTLVRAVDVDAANLDFVKYRLAQSLVLGCLSEIVDFAHHRAEGGKHVDELLVLVGGTTCIVESHNNVADDLYHDDDIAECVA